VAERDIWARFAEVERKLETLYDHLGIEMPKAEGEEEISEEVRVLIQEDKLMEAVKLHHEQTGVGLAEAKELVTRLRGTL
jgi:ribosomal protein L7/L12